MSTRAAYFIARTATIVGSLAALQGVNSAYRTGLSGSRPTVASMVLLFTGVIIGVIGAISSIYLRQRVVNNKTANQIAIEALANIQKRDSEVTRRSPK